MLVTAKNIDHWKIIKMGGGFATAGERGLDSGF
jgi:hypothetical protein